MSVSKVIQYPSQTGAYKVFVRDKNIWQKHNDARLQISIGNPKHDGDKFLALCEWASARFQHVTLIVSDSLQRHNIALTSKIDIEGAHYIALEQGSEWLIRNKSAIDIMPNKTITRWDDWLNHPDYNETFKKIRQICENDAEVKELLNETASGFSQKKIVGLNNVFLEAMTTASRNFIIEELAAFAIMMRETQAADIYPGTWFKELFSALSKYKEDPLLSGFPNAAYVRVDFTRNQSFEENLLRFK